MKRDMDLIRKILLHIEEHDNLNFAFEDTSGFRSHGAHLGRA